MKITGLGFDMAYIVRNEEIVPVPIPVGKRVKIGSAYNPPLKNYVFNDQLWIQDVFAFKQIPWYAIRNRFERWLFLACMWFASFYILTIVGRYLM